MVDAPRAEVDRERDRPALGELVAVQAEREPGRRARLEVAARLRRVERAALEEDVGRVGELRRLGEHVGEDEVEVRVGIARAPAAPRARRATSASRRRREPRCSDASSVSRSSP